MNQETYEMVLHDAKFLSECIDRDTAKYIMQLEGKGYMQYNSLGMGKNSYKNPFKLKLCQAGGTVIINSVGENVYYLNKYDEHITCNTDNLQTKRTNILFGIEKSFKHGSIQIDSLKTGAKVTVNYLDPSEGHPLG